MGLARAFLQAGATAVLASLFPVDDADTRDFMQAYYRRLQAGEDRAQALASVRREWREGAGGHPLRVHPLFWASFVLIDRDPQPGA